MFRAGTMKGLQVVLVLSGLSLTTVLGESPDHCDVVPTAAWVLIGRWHGGTVAHSLTPALSQPEACLCGVYTTRFTA